MSGDRPTTNQFKVLKSDLAYSGWRKILKKTVRIDDEREYVFDVVHQVSLPHYHHGSSHPPCAPKVVLSCSRALVLLSGMRLVSMIGH